jgi:hypothetical protein
MNNRRARRRMAPKRSTKVACYKGALGLGSNIAVSVLDVSENGIRLLVKTALEPDQEIVIRLEGLGQRPHPLKLAASVMWCVPTADGNFCVGTKFQRTLQYADLHAIACV